MRGVMPGGSGELSDRWNSIGMPNSGTQDRHGPHEKAAPSRPRATEACILLLSGSTPPHPHWRLVTVPTAVRPPQTPPRMGSSWCFRLSVVPGRDFALPACVSSHVARYLIPERLLDPVSGGQERLGGVKSAVCSASETSTGLGCPRSIHSDQHEAPAASRSAPISPACPKISNSSAPSMR